jgi:hypothetical protein
MPCAEHEFPVSLCYVPFQQDRVRGKIPDTVT